jgi:lysophospholipase L1-like esterase
MADTDKLVKVGQLDTIVDEIVDKFGETNGRLAQLPALDGGALGIVDNSTFTIGKTFDSNGLPINATNRAITDFIKSAGGDVLIIVPNDGTIKVNAYMYNANKEHIAHGSYQTVSRVAHNVNAVYMRFVFSYINDTTADQNLVDSVRFYNMSAKLVTQYRGNILKLGYTSLVECVDDGYYSFGMADVPSITDLPYGTASGGTVQVFKHYANNVVYQILFIDNKIYYRFGSNPFKPLNQSAGNPIIPTWESGAINQTTGEDATSNTRIRFNGKIAIGQGIKVVVPADMEISLIAYNSNGERIGTTGLQQSDFIHYPYRGETHFRMYAGYIDKRTTITTSDGAKYGIFYLPISADAPMWYALGDSITQGFYSEEGTDGIAGETPNNYPTYGAALMGWKLRNLGVGGSGYLKASTSLGLPNAKGQVNGIDFAYCDICTLAYGVNDWHYNQEIGTVNDSKDLGTTMASNMKYVIEKILSDNPRCRLNIMLPLNCSTYGGTFETDWGLNTELPTSGTLQHVIDVIRDVAEYYHLPIIDQSNTGIVNRYNINTVLPDGIHPSVETYKPYGERIVRQIV